MRKKQVGWAVLCLEAPKNSGWRKGAIDCLKRERESICSYYKRNSNFKIIPAYVEVDK